MRAAAASLEVLRAAQRSAVPWKNGGGLTREVVASPPRSDLTDFHWRISIADVRTPGPFSLFEGVERHMAILSGRLSLAIDGRPAMTLAPETDPVAFAGDVPATAAPLGGPVTDLNVMTRRARCRARLTRCGGPQSVLEPQAGTTVLIALAELTVRAAGTVLALGALDALRVVSAPHSALTVESGSTPYYLIDISSHPG